MLAALAVLVAVGCDSGDDEGDVVLIDIAEDSASACDAGVACWHEFESYFPCEWRAELLDDDDASRGYWNGIELGATGADNCDGFDGNKGALSSPVVWDEWVCDTLEECRRSEDVDEFPELAPMCAEALDPAGRC